MSLGANFWGIAGILLTLAFGIPSTIALFLDDQTSIGILAIVIVVIALVVIVAAWWYLTLPDYTLKDVDKTLILNDSQGRHATQVSNMTARANGPGLRHFDFRVWGADGTIQNFKVNDREPSQVHPMSGGTEIIEQFSAPLRRFEERDIKVAFDCIDTFCAETENWTHAVAYHTKRMRLKVEFPPERPCLSASAYLRYAGHPHGPIPGLIRSNDGRELRLEVNNPNLGAQYTIEWKW
jgi:hypothetical protein